MHKTHDGWVARVEFLHETKFEDAHMEKSWAQLKRNNVNVLNAKLGHPSEEITQDTEQAVEFCITSMFNPVKIMLREHKKTELVKRGERKFFDISFPSTPTLGGEKNWLQIEV